MTAEKNARGLLRRVLLSVPTLLLAASGVHAQAQALPDLAISFRAYQWIEDGGLLRAKLRLSTPNLDRDVKGVFSVRARPDGQIDERRHATPGTACGPGVDFVEVRDKEFVIPRGSLEVDFEIRTCADNALEGQEFFGVSVDPARLSGARCATAGLHRCEASVEFVDPPANPGSDQVLRINNAVVVQPRDGLVEAELSVSLTRTATHDVTVSYRTVNDTAVGSAPSVFFMRPDSCTGHHLISGGNFRRDFLPSGGQVVIPAGRADAKIKVFVCDDNKDVAAPDLTFHVALTGADAEVGIDPPIADGRGQVTIRRFGPGPAGSFWLYPDHPRVRAGDERVTFMLNWTVPPGQTAINIETIAVRLLDDPLRGQLDLVWQRNGFRLCRSAGLADDPVAIASGLVFNGCSPLTLSGAPTVLRTQDIAVHMATTRVVNYNHLDRTVQLEITLSYADTMVGERPVQVGTGGGIHLANAPLRRATSVFVLPR